MTHHILSIEAIHQHKIARKTLEMPDEMASVMGGMTKAEAREILGVPEPEGKRYLSGMPEHCDLCGAKITDGFIDGKTHQGPWAIMDKSCFRIFGVGLGTGRGQQYNEDGIKIAG